MTNGEDSQRLIALLEKQPNHKLHPVTCCTMLYDRPYTKPDGNALKKLIDDTPNVIINKESYIELIKEGQIEKPEEPEIEEVGKPIFTSNGGLIELYLDYHKLRTASPLNYGRHLIIQTIGQSFGRDTINSIAPRAVHHNTYLCLLGQSSKSMKTTSQEELIEPLIPPAYIGTKNFSPEGLLRALEDHPHKLCPMGEFSIALRGIKMGGHMANFKEISNDLFNCPTKYEKRLSAKENSYFISYPYLSISTTCTEEEFFPNLKPEMVHGGFLPRWILVYEKPPDRRKRKNLPDNIDAIENLFVNIINQLYKAYKNKNVKFKLTEKAIDRYDEICEELETNEKWSEIQPFVKRYENYIFVVLHAASLSAHKDRASSLELDAFIGENYVITLHTKPIPACSSSNK